MQQQGWAGLRNGDLLRQAAAAEFDIFVTADQNLQYQQNLAGSPFAIILLVARSNKINDLTPLVPLLLSKIRNVRPGEIRRISAW